MADKEDTPKTELEDQGEAKPQEAVPPQPTPETPPEAPADEYSPRQGETLEAYAARVRNEVSWRDRQLGQQHKRLKDRETRAMEIEAENQRLKEQAEHRPADAGKPPVAPQPRPAATPPAVDPSAVAAARVQLEMERTEAALLKNPEWPSALANFQRIGGIPQEVMNAVLDTDDPAHVLVTLGKDMNKFTQIIDLPEGKRRAALIKIGMEPEQKAAEPKAEPKKKPSEAPPPRPGLPAGGAAVLAEGDVDLYDEKFATPEYDDAWYRKRAEQKAQSKGRPWSYGGKSGATR